MSQLVCCDLCGGLIDGRYVLVSPIGWAEDMLDLTTQHQYHRELDETGRSCAGRVMEAIEAMSMSAVAD